MNRVRYPTSPKGGTKPQVAILLLLPVIFNFCRKKSAAKFLRVKTPKGIVVATSFLYLTVHRKIAGNVHIYLKFALKANHPIIKRRFRQISLIYDSCDSQQKSSIITNRNSTMRFPSSHRCTLCITPKPPKSQKGGSKQFFYKLLRCLSNASCR